MPDIVDILVVIGTGLLRFGVPALVVAGLAYLLKRMDKRWESEAYLDAGKTAGAPAKKRIEAPAAPRRVPAPELPFIPPPVREPVRPQIGLGIPQPTRPEQARTAGENRKANCTVSGRGDMPCWQVRMEAEGQIPAECANCPVFQRYPLM